MGEVWDENMKLRLRELAESGMSAAAMVPHFHKVVTRNAVIGAAHRYRIELKYTPVGQRRRGTAGKPRNKSMSERRKRKTSTGLTIPPKSNIAVKISFAGGKRPAQCMWHGCEDYATGPGKPFCSTHMRSGHLGTMKRAS